MPRAAFKTLKPRPVSGSIVEETHRCAACACRRTDGVRAPVRPAPRRCDRRRSPPDRQFTVRSCLLLLRERLQLLLLRGLGAWLQGVELGCELYAACALYTLCSEQVKRLCTLREGRVAVAHRVADEASDERQVAVLVAYRLVDAHRHRQLLLSVVDWVECVPSDRARGTRLVHLTEALLRRHLAVCRRERGVRLAHRARARLVTVVQHRQAAVALDCTLQAPVAGSAVLLEHRLLCLDAAFVTGDHLLLTSASEKSAGL